MFHMTSYCKEHNHPITEGDISAFMKKYNIKRLPDAYKEFLLKHNGGRVDLKFEYYEKNGEPDVHFVTKFYGIGLERIFNIEQRLSDPDILKQGLLPIADTGWDGDYICLGISGKYFNKVFVVVVEFGEAFVACAQTFEEFLETVTDEHKEPEVDELFEICQKGDLEALMQKIEKEGVSPDGFGTINGRNIRLVDICARNGHLEMLIYLKEKGASLNDLLIKCIASHFTEEAEKKDEVALWILKEGEEDIDQIINQKTWLHFAVEKKLIKTAQYLLENGISLDIREEHGLTAWELSRNVRNVGEKEMEMFNLISNYYKQE